jgi:integrase
VKTADKDERGHVENHLLAMFPGLRVNELKFLVIKQAFARARDDRKLAGRTLRNVHSTLRSILIEAAEDGLIDTAPTPLSARRDHLPPPIDRDSRWRESARFDRAEIAALLSCEDVPMLRRTIYAVSFLTGARISEVLGLRVSDYAALSPWPALTLRAAKVGRHRGERLRHVPVCPELRAWLDHWLAHEWPFLYGAAPVAGAHLFPSTSSRRKGLPVSQAELFKLWQRHDLPSAKLRHRRIHDARRTFISLLRSAGVPDKAVRACTHASTGDRILDAYTSWEWAALCGELGAVTWGVPKPRKIGTPAVPLFAGGRKTP